ncbi:MAG TPA: 5'-nucleotidase C-terminal domain-containing protein [Methylomirabilota bacterium]|nr:5'-nucleotidase C-terminal domain-containing protein [Methylomirabilota bacterium]
MLLCAGCAETRCADRPPVRIQLLLVNDVYELEPVQGRGGLARVATLVRELRRESPHTLFVLAGDTLSPSLLSTLRRGAQMIEAWNALGLDLATFGNHEFDFGPAVLAQRMGDSRFAWVSSNVLDSTGAPFGGARPWLRRDLEGVRVGVIALTTPEAARTSNPGAGVRFEAPRPAARRALDALGTVDLRVAVTHLPLREDRELADALPLDAILGGHDHDPMLHEQGRAVIVKAGADAINVGQVEYEIRCGAVIGRRARLIPIDDHLAEAPDVAALVRQQAALLARELDTVVGATAVPLEARESVTRREQTPLGRLFAELMRERVGAQVGLLNSGAIRGNRVIPAGPITRRDIRQLLPFSNTVTLLEVTGQALHAALEHSVDELPRPTGHYLQTAGVRFAVDPARPPGQRVGAVEVGGHPLDPAGLYRVAVPDYLAHGRDGYPMLVAARVLLAPEDGPGLIETVLAGLSAGRSP